MEQQQMDEKLYDQLVAYLAGKGTVREDVPSGVLVIHALDGRSFEAPFRLHVSVDNLAPHLREAAGGSPGGTALEKAWWQFAAHIHEVVEAAGPGETELVLDDAGLVSRRPE